MILNSVAIHLLLFVVVTAGKALKSSRNIVNDQYVTPHVHTTIQHMNESINVPLPSSLNSLFWLHIEKTGTSVGMMLYLHACPIVFSMVDMKKFRGRPIWEGKKMVSLELRMPHIQ
mmetsp:Transcript_6586/g.6819  ORF Transcript_6586/g.6819 Transcript_6586/m.6819 type:complete len:116 (-) Transcript_6586:66-413(-)